jgi:hypothetical protein
MDAGVSPPGVPAIEIGLRLGDRLEAHPLQRRPLGMADARFDFPLAIRITDPTRQRDDTVMGEDVSIERIERRIVDVRREHAFLEIVEATTWVEPSSRRNARSCSSAQICALDCQTGKRMDLRE